MLIQPLLIFHYNSWATIFTWKNQFKSKTHCSKLWLYNNVDLERRNPSSPLVIKWSLFVKLWFPFTKGYCVPSLVEIAPIVLEKKLLNFVNVFSLFPKYLPVEKDWVFHFSKVEFPSPKDAVCQVWLKMTQWFLRRFINFVSVFSQFRNYLSLENSVNLEIKLRWDKKR